MNKRTFYFIMAITLLATACQNSGSSASSQQADTVPVSGIRETNPCDSLNKAWTSFPNNYAALYPNKDVSKIRSMPVDTAIARECINEYISKLGGATPNITGVKFTDAIQFTTTGVNDWLRINDVFRRSTVITIELGIYTQHAYDMLQADGDVNTDIPVSSIGKVTAFISPYNVNARARDAQGAVIKPFNLGSLHP